MARRFRAIAWAIYQTLNLVTSPQQEGAIQPQLLGQMRGRNPVGDSSEHEDDLGTRQTALAPYASGE